MYKRKKIFCTDGWSSTFLHTHLRVSVFISQLPKLYILNLWTHRCTLGKKFILSFHTWMLTFSSIYQYNFTWVNILDTPQKFSIIKLSTLYLSAKHITANSYYIIQMIIAKFLLRRISDLTLKQWKVQQLMCSGLTFPGLQN